MADLANKIDDLICTFDGTLNTRIDTLAMYMFGIFVFVFVVFVLTYHLYGKYREPKAGIILEKPNVNSVDAKTTKESQKNVTPLNITVGKTVPSSPTVRKRIVSKPSIEPSLSPSRTKPVSLPPSATGPESESVKWVNDFFRWLYSDSVVVNDLANTWIQALNKSMKSSITEHGVGVELIGLLPETHPPSLNNVFCECASNDDIKITCDCEGAPAMQLKAFRQRGDKVDVSNYRVNVNKFLNRLNITCITEKLCGYVKFDGWPEIKIMLAQVGSLKNNNLDEQSLQEVIIEILASALRQTDVNFNLDTYPNCPRFVRRPVSSPQHLPLHYDSLLTSSNTNLSKSSEKLLVKVIKGTGLGPVDGSIYEPYCVVEVDNPPQTNLTTAVRGSDSPNWNEQFTFNVNLRTKEIMFEVYNTSQKSDEKNRFLGLAIVSVQELLESVAQRQVISLQPRPYQNDKVTGTLTLEFTCMDNAEFSLANGVLKDDEKSHVPTTPNKNRPFTSKTVNPMERDSMMTNSVVEMALNDSESQNLTLNTTSPNKSTVIIHSVQKQSQPMTAQEDLPADKTLDQNNHHLPATDKSQDQTDMTDNLQNSDDAGRGRRRKRDFFGTIRKRLNRSRGRAKSIDQSGYNGDVKSDPSAAINQYNSPTHRSTSADRTRDHSTHSAHSTVGPLPQDGSARSSLSEISGVSGASSRTYLNEASTLILEIIENGINKYYLVPLSLAQKNKWKKKGVKLHIYNEHTFVAKHLPGGTTCQICNRTLPRRFGKQGYECRDCLMKCHKQCHVRTDTNCPSSTVQSLELSGSLKIPKLGAGR